MDRDRTRVAAFVAAVAVYYAVYFALFSVRVKAYFGDILRHFEFVRRLLGVP
jgi:hypothetical protein